MDNLGGSHEFAGFGIGYNKGIALGAFNPNIGICPSSMERYRFWGGPIAFGAFCTISFISRYSFSSSLIREGCRLLI